MEGVKGGGHALQHVVTIWCSFEASLNQSASLSNVW